MAVAWVWLLVLLIALVVQPALTRDIGAVAYDAATEHIYRGVAFSDAVSDGVLYPRWVQSLHWGLGSPLFTFQPPLPYYGMDVLARLGFSHPIGWRILVTGGFALAFSGAYLLVYEVTKRRWPAIVAAVAFLYAPYVLRNALERGSNEAYSVLLYPLVLWSLIWVARRPGAGRFVLATLIWAACIASHVLGPLMLAPFALVLAIYLCWQRRTIAPIAVLVAGGLLTAAIWAPMGTEQQWVHVQRDFTQADAIPSQNPIPLDRLLATPAVYDTVRDNNNVGDRIGLVHALILLAGVAATLYARSRHHRLAWVLGAVTLTALLLFWLFTSASDPVWRAAAPIMGRLLYRTRLMGVQALMAALVAGLIVAVLPTRWQRPVAVVFIVLLVAAAMPSLYVELQHRYAAFRDPVDLAQVREVEVRTGGTALTAFGEFEPRWRTAPFDDALMADIGRDFDAQAQPLAQPPVGVQVQFAQVRNGAWDLDITASTAETLTLHLLYYPRWQAFVDGQPASINPQAETGYAQVAVPAGEHHLTLRYGRTLAERMGLVISGLTAAGLVLVGGWAIWRRRKRTAVVEPSTGTADVAPPPLWLLAVLTVLVLFKWFYVDTATTWLRCVSTPARVCGAQAAVDAVFMDAPRLRGYSTPSAQVAPGEALRIDLFWEDATDADGAGKNLSSFVHIRNSQPGGTMNPRTGSEIWAQDEHVAPGGLLTTEYLPGKLYKDEFRIRLPDDIPPGEYFLEVGWFDPATGEQVDLPPDGAQPPLRILWRSVLLPSIQVR